MLTLPNIDYVLGDSVPLRGQLVDENTFVAADLTGALDAWFTLKELPTDPDADAVISKRLGAGIAITTPTSGIVEVFPSAAETAALVADLAYFGDLRVKTAGGFIVTSRFTVTMRRQATISAA